VPLAAWFQRRGATVVLVPAEQSADLRAYYAKSTKTDRLDAELLARLPLLHPDGLHPETTNGPGDPLKRAVKLRSGLVHRRSACMQRLDALLEILGLGWVEALGSDMTQTACKFLAGWANPHQVKRLGRARLARWFQRQTRKAWGERRADAVVAAAEATLALWGPAGLDYEALAADIATEASLALELSRQIARLDEPIFDHYGDADPDQLLLFGARGGQDPRRPDPRPARRPHRFTSLAAARSFSGLIPHQHSSGLTDAVGGPTKHGDACLREALFLAADHARKTDPTLAARYQRLMGQTGRHHTSALCTIATVLRTRIVTTPLPAARCRGSPITPAQGRAIVAERYQIPPEVRAARRTISNTRSRHRRRDERIEQGVAKRSTTPPVPPASLPPARHLDNH
jgi:transposase